MMFERTLIKFRMMSEIKLRDLERKIDSQLYSDHRKRAQQDQASHDGQTSWATYPNSNLRPLHMQMDGVTRKWL